MSHGNARLTPAGRLLPVRRVAAGEPQAEVARQMRLSRATVAKWWGRWVEHGDAALTDRSSRPNRSPRRTDAATEERICRLRRRAKRGPAYLSARTGVPASTIWRVLRRHGLNRLDRPTGRTIRRYEKAAPGELVHLDVKKVAKVPPGGGWRVHGRGSPKARRSRGGGYTYLHLAVDDYSRVAYVEACDDETAATLAGFWTRAQDWFSVDDMAVDAVMTDNGPNFCSALLLPVIRKVLDMGCRVTVSDRSPAAVENAVAQLGAEFGIERVTDLLTGDYDPASEQWEKAKRIFNILGDRVETVTPWLAEHLLAADKPGSRIMWLTRRKAFARFALAPFRKRDLFTA